MKKANKKTVEINNFVYWTDPQKIEFKKESKFEVVFFSVDSNKNLLNLWENYSQWYSSRVLLIRHWYIESLQDFVKQYWLKSYMSDSLEWNYDNFIKFFENKILPLCDNNKMVSSDRLYKMWWKYRKWNAKFRLFSFPDKFKDYNEFLDLYNLECLKKQKYKWWEKNIISFFENKILPKCKDNIMLKYGEVAKLWHKYSSWQSSFFSYIKLNTSISCDTFFNKYWLKHQYLLKEKKYKWDEKVFFNYFEEFILPKCKNNKLISWKEFYELGWKYKSWYFIFNKSNFYWKFKTKQEFYKHYNLKQNKGVAKKK